MTRTADLHPKTKPDFQARLAQCGQAPLRRRAVTTIQVNVGRLCNQMCHHCHVEAGPGRREIMDERTAQRVLQLLDQSPGIELLDITGGAPEMNPSFQKLVSHAREAGRAVSVRSNLTILMAPGYEHLIGFLAEQGVDVIASLPCYTASNVDSQRGDGVFDLSMKALLKLNAAGFGQEGSNLRLNLVYNPLGATLPPPQEQLEADYKRELREQFGVLFNNLFTITNIPIKRFADMLHRDGQYEAYMKLLADTFNSEVSSNVMCRDLLSVGWDGALFDCDFNQMLEMPLSVPGQGPPRTIWDIESVDALSDLTVATGSHCFGCTAGAGSSCGGTLES